MRGAQAQRSEGRVAHLHGQPRIRVQLERLEHAVGAQRGANGAAALEGQLAAAQVERRRSRARLRARTYAPHVQSDDQMALVAISGNQWQSVAIR